MTQKTIENIKRRGAVSEIKAEILDKLAEVRMAWDCSYNSDDEFINFQEAMDQACDAIADAQLLFEELKKLEPGRHK